MAGEIRGQLRVFLLPKASLPATDHSAPTLLLDQEQSHHLLKVLRFSASAELRLTDGEGHFFRGELVGQRGGRACVRIQERWEDPTANCPPRLVLACAVVKARRFEWVLQKSVELGVHEVRPLRTARSVVRPRSGRQQRWQSILQTALKQAGRSLLPRLFPVMDLPSFLEDLTPGPIFFGNVPEQPAVSGCPPKGEPVAGVLDILAEPGKLAGPVPSSLVWVVGPEGGLTPPEDELLRLAGGVPVRLGPHRLRSETAALVGLAFLQLLRQEWQGQSVAGA